MIRLFPPHPPPPPPPPPPSHISKLDRRHIGKLRENLLTGEEVGGVGAKSYDGEKAWSAITHLILSARVSERILQTTEPVFANVTGAQESIPSQAGRYDNPV
jgi:hypothetical protein